jgi:large subunit ribosomal protein L30
MAKKNSSQIRVTLTRSPIGKKKHQRVTLKTLGLRRMHQNVVHNDTPSIRGMLEVVKHLVHVEELD